MEMNALRKAELQDYSEKAKQLKRQLECCGSVPEHIRVVVEKFLIHQGIFSIEDIQKNSSLVFANYLEERQVRNKAKVQTYLHALKKYQQEYQKILFKSFWEEAKDCKMEKHIKTKALNFLMEKGIKHLVEIDCEIREEYSTYLEKNIAKRKWGTYLKGLDGLKLHATRLWQESHPLHMPKITYESKKIYLSYLPIYALAQKFYYIQDKECLFWDFGIETSETLKKQIFQVLAYALINIEDTKDCKVRYLLPLSWLYAYCIEQHIENLEYMELAQIEGFRKVVAGKVVNVNNSMQIVDNARKCLFLGAKETNWDANVWYMERFQLQRERMNPSNPIIRLSFLEVQHKGNRRLLQEYMKYHVGISNRSMIGVRQGYYQILDFLRYLDKGQKATQEVTAYDMDNYFKEENQKEILPQTYNVKVAKIFQLFRFLKAKQYIEKVPFFLEYYLKTAMLTHHDRSLEQDMIKKILHNLYRFPHDLRLMYLNLWCIGLRANEVCTLKGDAYFWHNDAAWIRVYQYKMRSEKVIPIPKVLYKLMTDYIEKNQITPEEYIFKSAKGQAYHVGTFTKQMIEELQRCGIHCEEYRFKSHDYRHTVATSLYAHGASLQAIRDYLGHDHEEMTMQYIDYLPEKINEANETYFERQENRLAAKLKERKQDEGQNLLM